jgi:signal peptidase I
VILKPKISFLVLAAVYLTGCQSVTKLETRQRIDLPWVSVAHPGSFSMFPREMGRPMFSVEEYPFEKLKSGDIVCFRANWIFPEIGKSQYVIHRIVSRDWRTNLFITKGDRNEYPDPGVLTSSSYIGLVKVIDFR